MTKKKPATEGVSPEEVSRVMTQLAYMNSPAKDAARARNAVLGGRPLRPLSEFECNCGAGDSIEGHKTNCPRGRAILRRKAKGIL